MQEPSTYQIHVGAFGWTPDDARGFYPDDLPPEWRLMYYNNFFSCVYLPYALWASQDPVILAQWCNDTLPRFRFVLQLEGGEPSAADAEKIRALGAQVGLVVPGGAAPEAVLWLEDFGGIDAAVQKARGLAESGKQAYLLSRAANFPMMEQVAALLESMQL
jgi:hypothetical protein